MDRRSWLWRRKSSEKSPGEIESSGSLSSPSERFFDDQVYANQTTQSPEDMSKAEQNEEEASDVQILTERLSAALLEISAKEELVQQHAKVAEEAVSGWEKAENELATLKQQLDSSKQKNSVLEGRVSHLDGALKECMKQLRQARDDNDVSIPEFVPNESESEKSELEKKVVELEAQLETARADAGASIRSDLCQRLEEVEKENSSLRNELQSRLEELELRIIERDLSTQAAETASKQHLESIKKVTKLEAECRRIKAIAHKTLSANDHRSHASSTYVESYTDSSTSDSENDTRKFKEHEPSHSDSWALIAEVDQVKNENSAVKNFMVHSAEINLMDDFLEMERLAALPDADSGSSFVVVRHSSDQPNVDHDTNKLKAEMEAVVQKNAELEKKLEITEAEKNELEMSLNELQNLLEASENQINEAKSEVAELQTQLALASKSNEEAYEELKVALEKNEITESKLVAAQAEVQELTSKICSLEEEIEKERDLSAENLAKCEKVEEELLRMKHEAQLQQHAEILHEEVVDGELQSKQEKELELAASRFAECRKTIESLGQQLNSLATFEDFLIDSDKPMDLACEVTPPSLQKGFEQLKLQGSDLDLGKRDSESPISLKQSINHEKNGNSFGRSYPRSKSVRRTRNH